MATLINPNPIIHELGSRSITNEQKEKIDPSLLDSIDIFGKNQIHHSSSYILYYQFLWCFQKRKKNSVFTLFLYFSNSFLFVFLRIHVFLISFNQYNSHLDMISTIKDPEHPYTLQQLNVVKEDQIVVTDDGKNCVVWIEFTPTVPHCNLATTIGLCLQRKLTLEIGPIRNLKIDISITPGSHQSALEVTKQINDKERVSAALENPHLRGLVESCIKSSE